MFAFQPTSENLGDCRTLTESPLLLSIQNEFVSSNRPFSLHLSGSLMKDYTLQEKPRINNKQESKQPELVLASKLSGNYEMVILVELLPSSKYLGQVNIGRMNNSLSLILTAPPRVLGKDKNHFVNIIVKHIEEDVIVTSSSIIIPFRKRKLQSRSPRTCDNSPSKAVVTLPPISTLLNSIPLPKQLQYFPDSQYASPTK
jgi:hypothetical protein